MHELDFCFALTDRFVLYLMEDKACCCCSSSIHTHHLHAENLKEANSFECVCCNYFLSRATVSESVIQQLFCCLKYIIISGSRNDDDANKRERERERERERKNLKHECQIAIDSVR